MTEAAVREYVAAVRPRDRAASKRRKGRWLDEICTTTGRHRKSVIRGPEPSRPRPPDRPGARQALDAQRRCTAQAATPCWVTGLLRQLRLTR